MKVEGYHNIQLRAVGKHVQVYTGLVAEPVSVVFLVYLPDEDKLITLPAVIAGDKQIELMPEQEAQILLFVREQNYVRLFLFLEALFD